MSNTYLGLEKTSVSRGRIVLFVLLFASSMSRTGFSYQGSDQSRSPADVVRINRSISFGGFPTPSPFFIDLGNVETGAKIQIVTTIENKSVSDIAINKISVECSCTSVETSAATIKAGESVELTVLLAVQKRGTSRNFKSVILKQSEDQQIELRFGYDVAGACFFAEKSLSVRAPLTGKKVEFRIPVVVTPPVNPAKVLMHGTGDFENIKTSIGHDASATFIQCELEIPESDSFSLGGLIVMENPLGGEPESISCFVSRENRIVISPGTVRFVRRNDRYEAAAIIRLNKELLPKDATQSMLHVGAKLEGIKLAISQKDLSPGIARVQLAFSEKDALGKDAKKIPLPSQIEWQVSWDGGIAEMTNNVQY
jgi:hypothetical protein